MPQARSFSEREADALANMMGADSRRIDDLVGDVGEIKGDMRTLKADSARTATGVEQLQQSMVVLSRHAVLMETQSAEIASIRAKHEKLDTRVQVIEKDMPPLKEARAWMTRGILMVLCGVGLALLTLVIRK